MSDPREEGRTTTGHFYATQFTSVGIPGSDDFGWEDGRDKQSIDLVRALSIMRAEMTNSTRHRIIISRRAVYMQVLSCPNLAERKDTESQKDVM